MAATVLASTRVNLATMSLLQLLRPEIMADPYPFYKKLRAFEPVHWDAYLHSWVVTSYAESVTALSKFMASRTPEPETLAAMGMEELAPYAAMMLKQLMFMDAPQHTRLRGLCAVAFTPKRVQRLRERIQRMAEDLVERMASRGEADLVEEYAAQLPGFAMTALLGVPQADHTRLKRLSNSLGELIGNFSHEPERLRASVGSMRELQRYFQAAVDEQRQRPCEGLISALLASEIDGARLSDAEVIANAVLILVGGLEETTNLIGAAVLTLMREPEWVAELQANTSHMSVAVEELLRFQSPTQHTGRIAPEDVTLGGKDLRKGDSVTIVLAAANRDPQRFVEPERLDLRRTENRHLAFGYAAHYCMGAPLTRMTTQIALSALLPKLTGLTLADEPVWRQNMGLRGLESLHVRLNAPARAQAGAA